MLKHYEGEHCMNWRRTEGHDKTVSECFPCLWPEINKTVKNIHYKNTEPRHQLKGHEQYKNNRVSKLEIELWPSG